MKRYRMRLDQEEKKTTNLELRLQTSRVEATVAAIAEQEQVVVSLSPAYLASGVESGTGPHHTGVCNKQKKTRKKKER